MIAGSSPQAAPALPEARLKGVEDARRRAIIKVLSASTGSLSFASVFLLLAIGAETWPSISAAAGSVGLIAAFVLARRTDLDGSLAAKLMILSLLVQQVTTAMGLERLRDVAVTMTFPGLLPLIAAATLTVRGTVGTLVGALLGMGLVVTALVGAGHNPEEVGRFLGGPAFFIAVSGAVAIVMARASRSARRVLLEEANTAVVANAAARAADEKLRLVADQVSDLVALLDENGRYTFASGSYEHILDRSPATLLNTATPELLHPDDLETLAGAFRRAMGGDTQELVARLRTRSGDHRPFHMRLSRVQIEGQALVALTARDVTELQHLTAQLEGSRRMESLGRLAGGVAHDFNNLLSVIGASGHILRSAVPPTADVTRDLDAIDEAVRSATDLTSHLLSFAKGQALAQGSTAPAEVALRVVPLLERALGGTIRCTVDADASRWRAPVTAGQFEQILMNFAMNAKDAMPEGGAFELRIRDRNVTDEIAGLEPGAYVVVEASDTGSGMSDEVQSHVFEPFYSTKAPGQGTGLGLATAYGIARRLGGLLTVESTVGDGSTFRLYLPREIETQDVPAES